MCGRFATDEGSSPCDTLLHCQGKPGRRFCVGPWVRSTGHSRFGRRQRATVAWPSAGEQDAPVASEKCQDLRSFQSRLVSRAWSHICYLIDYRVMFVLVSHPIEMGGGNAQK